jgi:hypothetical protein
MTSECQNPDPLARPVWKEPWFEISGPEHKSAIERELALEIGPQHALWGTNPSVIGVRQDCDDVAVELADGRFAIVHPIWHGHIDQFPKEFPFSLILAGLPEPGNLCTSSVAVVAGAAASDASRRDAGDAGHR